MQREKIVSRIQDLLLDLTTVEGKRTLRDDEHVAELTRRGLRLYCRDAHINIPWSKLIDSTIERVSSRAYEHDEGRKIINGLKRMVKEFEEVARDKPAE